MENKAIDYKKLDKCLACNSTFLIPKLFLEYQPLANRYLDHPDNDIEKYPLELNYCYDCTHCQLSIAVDPEKLYSNYLYVSGTTDTLKQHFKDLVESSKQYTKGNRVLDIACNDGSLLEQFKKSGFVVEGVDPAENLRSITKAKMIPVLVDFWNSNTAFKMLGNYSIITILNCLAHVSDPFDFLKGCTRVLHENGVIIVEFPYFGNTLAKQDLGQVYHEHHSYFTARSFITLAERLNLSIIDTQMFPSIHGGTIRLVLQRSLHPHCQKIRQLANEEQNISHQLDEFAINNSKLVQELAKTIKKLKNQGKYIYTYSASAKSSTLFNLYAMRDAIKCIDFVVDDSPLKQQKYCPGSNLLIRSPQSLSVFSHPPESNVFIITAHNFKSEIMKRLKSLGQDGATVLNYTPEVSTEVV